MAIDDKTTHDDFAQTCEGTQVEEDDVEYRYVKTTSSAATGHNLLPPLKDNPSTALQIPRPNKPHRTSSASSHPSLLSKDHPNQSQFSRSISPDSNSSERTRNIIEKEYNNNNDKSAFWTRNKGIVAMLVSQFFGTLMGLTTRFLELEGEGMHPFQVWAYFASILTLLTGRISLTGFHGTDSLRSHEYNRGAKPAIHVVESNPERSIWE